MEISAPPSGCAVGLLCRRPWRAWSSCLVAKGHPAPRSSAHLAPTDGGGVPRFLLSGARALCCPGSLGDPFQTGDIARIAHAAERSACPTRDRNASSSNGFARKANAPPSSAAARIAGVSRAVIKITFVSGDTSRSRACTSRPLVFGIHTSSTAKDTAWVHACVRKSSATSKLCAVSPSESSSCSIECRTEASSSRIHMDLGCGGIGSAPDTNQVLVLTYATYEPTPMVPWGHTARALRPPSAPA